MGMTDKQINFSRIVYNYKSDLRYLCVNICMKLLLVAGKLRLRQSSC